MRKHLVYPHHFLWMNWFPEFPLEIVVLNARACESVWIGILVPESTLALVDCSTPLIYLCIYAWYFMCIFVNIYKCKKTFGIAVFRSLLFWLLWWKGFIFFFTIFHIGLISFVAAVTVFWDTLYFPRLGTSIFALLRFSCTGPLS